VSAWPHQPRVPGDRRDADRDHQVVDPRSPCRHDRHCQQHAGEGEHDVHQPHRERVDDAAGEAGDETEQTPERHPDQGCEHADRERNPGPVNDPAQHVATKLIGPERVRTAGSEAHLLQVAGGRIRGRHEPRRDGTKREQQEKEQTDRNERLGPGEPAHSDRRA
jgi:hypothetical protein